MSKKIDPRAMSEEIAQHINTEPRHTFGKIPTLDPVAEKPRYDLVPVSAYRAIATVFTEGAHGRPDHDWRERPYEYSKCLASLERHIMDFKEGRIEDIDTGLPVLWHAIARLAMLIEWESMPPGMVKNDLYGHHFEYQGDGK